MSTNTARSLSGPARRPSGDVVRRGPPPQLEELGRVVSVAGHGRTERELAEVLQQVVEVMEAGVALGPHRVACREEIRGKGRQPEQVVAAVHDHVDRQVIAGQHHELGPDLIAQRQPLPLQLPVEG